jgi:orotidine-5'-phosphate decarboxylase
MQAARRTLVALDTPRLDQARDLAQRLRGHVGGYKIGLELFASHGPDAVRELGEDAELFIDLKLHDIPNTVAGAAAAVARLGARYMTVHATGGPKMIRRAVEASAQAADEAGHAPPVVLAVTVLTSHDDDELAAIGLEGPCAPAVLRLAAMARDAGAGGLVCSPKEVAAVRKVFPEGVLVVPGIRPGTGSTVVGDDQSRTATPGRAIAEGADRLVMGRPITQADDPAAAADSIAAEIESGAS